MLPYLLTSYDGVRRQQISKELHEWTVRRLRLCPLWIQAAGDVKKNQTARSAIHKLGEGSRRNQFSTVWMFLLDINIDLLKTAWCTRFCWETMDTVQHSIYSTNNSLVEVSLGSS